MKHLLKMMDLSKAEIIAILDLADQLKYEKKHGISAPAAGRKVHRADLPEIQHTHPRIL